MNKMLILVAAAASLAACAARPTDRAPAPVAATPEQAAKDADPISCTYERGVGSNIPKKVCMTASQRAAAEREAADTMQALQRTGGASGREQGL